MTEETMNTASTSTSIDEATFAMKTLLRAEMADKPFSELFSVTFDHRGAAVVGHLLLDTLEEQGYSIDEFDAVGALTAAVDMTEPTITVVNPVNGESHALPFIEVFHESDLKA